GGGPLAAGVYPRVQPQQVGRVRAREVQARHAGEQDLLQVAASGLGDRRERAARVTLRRGAVEHVFQVRDLGGRVVVGELTVVARILAVPVVLVTERDH